MEQSNKIKRNVVIYIIGSLTLAIIGGVIIAGGNEAGGLIFIISPILMMLLLRFFGGDGWRDAGLGLNMKQSWGWYLFSLLTFPIVFTVLITLGVISGVTTLNGSLTALIPLFLTGFTVQLIPRTIFALFEEWGWRGYLEPRLAALGVPDLKRHLFVGVIWAVWHFPLILSTDYTDINYLIFFPMFVIGVLVLAVVFGQIRKNSNSVWPGVLLHGMGNTIGWVVINSNLITINNKVLANFTPESVFGIVLWGIVAWCLLTINGRT